MEQPPATPYTEVLSRQLGPNYSVIPQKYQYDHLPAYLQEMTTPDNLCGLPIYSSKIRHQLLSGLSGSIRDGRDFAILKLDSDQLKMANEKVHRQFGDETIRYSAAFTSQVLDGLNLASPPLIFRSTTGGDELYIFFDRVTPDEINRLREAVKQINSTQKEVEIPLKSGPVKFRLSSSAGFVSSSEKTFSADIAATAEGLRSGKINHAFNLLQDMLDKADDRAGAVKVGHELSSLPLKDLLSFNPRQLKNYVSQHFGGGRVSRAGMNIISMIEQIAAYNHFQNPSVQSAGLSADLPDTAIDPEDPTLRQIVDTYNSIFNP